MNGGRSMAKCLVCNTTDTDLPNFDRHLQSRGHIQNENVFGNFPNQIFQPNNNQIGIIVKENMGPQFQARINQESQRLIELLETVGPSLKRFVEQFEKSDDVNQLNTMMVEGIAPIEAQIKEMKNMQIHSRDLRKRKDFMIKRFDNTKLTLNDKIIRLLVQLKEQKNNENDLLKYEINKRDEEISYLRKACQLNYFKEDKVGVFPGEADFSENEEDYVTGRLYNADIGDAFSFKLDEHGVLIRKVGYGGWSVAWLGYGNTVKSFFNVKICASDSNLTDVQNEAKTLQKVNDHTHIVQFFGTFGQYTSTDYFYCIVTEPLGASLRTYISNITAMIPHNPYFPMDLIRKVGTHVLRGLNHLHVHLKIVHMDIKPENILTTVTERSLYMIAKMVLDKHYKGVGMRSSINQSKKLVHPESKLDEIFHSILNHTPPPSSYEPFLLKNPHCNQVLMNYFSMVFHLRLLTLDLLRQKQIVGPSRALRRICHQKFALVY